jgi:hypothetical protein
MESIKSANLLVANAQAKASSAAPEQAKGTLLPVQVKLSPAIDSITVNHIQYQLQLMAQQDKAMLLKANAYALTLTEGLIPILKGQPSQLVALASAIEIALPQALITLASERNINYAKLVSLASRPQGYPLPPASVSGTVLQLTQELAIHLGNNVQLKPGEYGARIIMRQDRLLLKLDPILGRAQITLGRELKPETFATPQVKELGGTLLLAKAEPAQVYANLLQKLVHSAAQQPGTASSATSQTMPLTRREVMADGDVPTKTQFSGQRPLTEPAPSTQTSIAGQGGQGAPPAPSGQSADKSVMNTQATTPSETAKAPTDAEVKPQPNPRHAQATPAQTPASSPGNFAGTASAAAITGQQPQGGQESLDEKATSAPRAAGSPEQTGMASLLQKVFARAGELPRTNPKLQAPEQNLAGMLLKLLPRLSPFPLGELAEPDTLKSELLGVAGINLSAQLLNPTFTIPPNANALTTLFQLLLGARLAQQGRPVSAQLQQYLQQLQQKSGFSGPQLAQLDKADTLGSLGQIGNGMQLYQQASSDNGAQLSWFFALPYSLGQRHEQLEGKFEQTHKDEAEGTNQGWHLQLKFNLEMGPLLIKAHKHDETVDIQFHANSQPLLTRVSKYLVPLGKKLTQIGMTPGQLSTRVANVPATLLPGEHYLLKTQA